MIYILLQHDGEHYGIVSLHTSRDAAQVKAESLVDMTGYVWSANVLYSIYAGRRTFYTIREYDVTS